MHACLNPFACLVVVSVAGWMNQHQQHVVEYRVRFTRFGVSRKNGFRLPKFSFKRKERLGAANPLGVKIVIDWTEPDVYFQPPEIQKTNSGR